MTAPRPVPSLRQGTVTDVSATTVGVDLGASGSIVQAGWIGERPLVGDVVWALQLPGSTLVVGVANWDPWHKVGAAGEPAFQSFWQNISGTRPLGFRRIGNRVELCGTVGTSAATTANTGFFTLPSGYVPDVNLRFPINANIFGGTTYIGAVIFVNGLTSGIPGTIQLITFAGSVQFGAVGFEGISFPLIGAV